MSVYIDADVVVQWEKREFDLPSWLEKNVLRNEVGIPVTVWQQLNFGAYDWGPDRAGKRKRHLANLSHFPIIPFARPHAERAAALASTLKRETIGIADLQIAATALVDDAELLTFNREHFSRVPGLKLAAI